MLHKFYTLISILYIICVFSTVISAKTAKQVKVGFFEAGKYDIHSIFRDEYLKQLETMLPDSIQIVTIPDGYRSAEWNRALSKNMANELSQNNEIDILLAIGPWVVQDLLDAGFEKPIIGVHQFNPKAEGLLIENDRPKVENLTVHFRPGKVLEDIQTLTKLFQVERLGVLSFPSDDNLNPVFDHIKSLGKQYGFKVVSTNEYDNNGTFAFYKSYNSLKNKHVDAIYLGPLWGMNSLDITNFFIMLNREKVPSFTDEGSFLLQEGAVASNDYFGIASEAYFNAFKTVEIINGATPADLPVIFRSNSHLAINAQSAKLCGVKIRADVYNSYQVIGEEDNSDITPSSLSELVNKAISQNPHILSQLDLLDAAEAQTSIVKSAYKPQLLATAELDYTDNNYHHNLGNSSEKDIFSSSIHFSQTLFSIEKLKEIQAAKELQKITEINKLSEQLDLELAVSLAYLDILKFQEHSNSIKNVRNMLSYNLEILHAKNYLTPTDSLDYLRIENYRYNMTLAYIENNRMFKKAQVVLNSLLNLPPEEKILLQKSYFSEDQFINSESPVLKLLETHFSQKEIGNVLLEKMISQNQSQTKSDALISYQKTILAQSKASFYPEFKLHGSLFYDNNQTESLTFEEKKSSWYVGGKVCLPFFLGGKRSQEKKKAQALLSAAEFEKDQSSLEIMRKGLSNYHRYLQFVEQMIPAYQANQRSNSTVKIANEKFNKNYLSTSDYLEILKASIHSQKKLTDTRYNYYASMAYIVHDLSVPVSDSYTDFVQQFHLELNY